jgi:regulator of cell morphogenesis and NO signaling
MKNEFVTKTLAQIVKENHQTAAVFEKYNLDFCCRGKRSLQEACEENNLSTELVVDEVNNLLREETPPPIDFDKLSLSELVDYIVAAHHAYTKRELPQIYAYLQKVSSKHGERNPELYLIFETFSELKEEMELHMKKEELILFPTIKELERGIKSPNPSNIQVPISVMEDEHDHAGRCLEQIRLLSNNYAPPADACTTYRLSFAALQAFEKDLHQHVHLENNILFPKAVETFAQRTTTSGC